MMNNNNSNFATYWKPVVPWYKKVWYAVTFKWKKINPKWQLLGSGITKFEIKEDDE